MLLEPGAAPLGLESEARQLQVHRMQVQLGHLLLPGLPGTTAG